MAENELAKEWNRKGGWGKKMKGEMKMNMGASSWAWRAQRLKKSSSRKQIKERLTALQEWRNGEFNRPNEQEQTTNEPITDF